MALVHLQALLPTHDGTGWYAMVEGRDTPHRCSTKECEEMAVAYHKAFFGHIGKRARHKYHCQTHLNESLVVIQGRVWLDRQG